MRAVLTFLFTFFGIGFVATARLSHIRAKMPYNEAGRYFEDGLVYHQHSTSAYAILAVLLFVLTALVGLWIWRSRKGRADGV